MKLRICTLLALLALVGRAGAQTRPERYATLPAVSPDGRWIAYVRDFSQDSSELHVVGVDGAGDRVLRSGGPGGVPGWADRGRRVTMALSSRDSSTLWSMGPDGADTRVLAARQGHALSLSNDGKRVAWSVGDWQRSRLMVSDVDGRRARALTDSTAGWFNIAWSPDDRRLAVSHLDSTGAMQVWVMEVASGHAEPLTGFAASEGRPQWPTWSPDGKRVAVQSGHYDREHPEKNEADVWIVEVASHHAAKLGTRTGVWMDETPAWSPDGKRIVFQSTRTGRFEIWSAKVDGTDARQVK